MITVWRWILAFPQANSRFEAKIANPRCDVDTTTTSSWQLYGYRKKESGKGLLRRARLWCSYDFYAPG